MGFENFQISYRAKNAPEDAHKDETKEPEKILKKYFFKKKLWQKFIFLTRKSGNFSDFGLFLLIDS